MRKQASTVKFQDFKAFEVKKTAQKDLKGGQGDSIIIDELIDI